jgi:hypothetical protein
MYIGKKDGTLISGAGKTGYPQRRLKLDPSPLSCTKFTQNAQNP